MPRDALNELIRPDHLKGFDITVKLPALLSTIERPGSFCGLGAVPLPVISIQVDGVGLLGLPIPVIQAEAIARIAEPAP